METSLLSREEVAQHAKALYEQSIRRQVETDENIGKMVVIDIETGDFAVDEMGIDSSQQLQARHPNGRLYGIRIGYNVAESLGGVMERSARPNRSRACSGRKRPVCTVGSPLKRAACFTKRYPSTVAPFTGLLYGVDGSFTARA